MRKNFGPKPFLYPQLVMVIASYGKDGTPDAMNAAWGGIAGATRSSCASAPTIRPWRTSWSGRPLPSAWRTRLSWTRRG